MSPVPLELCLAARDLSEPRLLPGGDALGMVVADPDGTTLQLHDLRSGTRTALTPSAGLRAGRGLGGGAWWPLADGTFVVVGGDGNLWRLSADGAGEQRLTDHDPARPASSPHVDPSGRWLVYAVDQAEVWLLDLVTAEPHRLDDGSADFCLDPWVTLDGARWVEWDVPSMPWDDARLGRWAPGGGRPPLHSAGAVQQPRCAADGAWWHVDDAGGWLNIHRAGVAVVTEPFEHAGPSWGPGQRSYAVSPDGSLVAFARNERGFGRLCVAHAATGAVQEVARGVHGQLSWEGRRVAAVRSGARTPTQVAVYDTNTWERTVVEQGPSAGWHVADLVEPEPVEVPTAEGVVHARLYLADGRAHVGEDRASAGRVAAGPGEEGGPRLMVWLHGGPTDQWQVTFMPRLAYWRSRGWNILLPDHRGSTGHGRGYQRALLGRWGELDVTDVVAATSAAHRRGWGTPATTAILGGSAGGFTLLGAVAAAPHLFAAAVASYPVTDLVGLAGRSHRFERHYTDGLVGPLPQSVETYRGRSPLHFAHRLTDVPLLLLHGDADPVVPVEQSVALAQRITAEVGVAGSRVELHIYPGEGHGFRQPANQADEYRRIGEFLARTVPAAPR